MAAPGAGSVRFGSFRLNVRSGELSRDGNFIRLPPQASKLLLLLVEARGELVTYEEIQKALWTDDTFVEYEQGIYKCVKQIRAALEDDAESPVYVETVSRRGYRFLEKVEVSAAAAGERETSPYPGLSSFSEKDAPFFFGREREVDGLWEKIEGRKLLALIGPSGVGKSSFLQAGVVPGRPRGWRVVSSKPGSAPGASLTRALLWEKSQEGEAERVLVIVDAFEELFTLNPLEVQREFAETLGRLSSEEGVHVLLSMRDDFLFRCHEHESLAPVFRDLTPLGPPKAQALRRALVEPARACGYAFESDELAAEMLSEVEGERGALPLLAFAAAHLWDERDRERKLLTRDAYETGGRVGGALAQHADSILEGIGAARTPVVRELFRNLVTAQGTRVSREVEDLLSVFPTEDERTAARRILRELVAARLLTSYETSVEIIHESLLTTWPRLVHWRTQDTEGTQFRDQLRQAAQLWEEKGRPRDLLWFGTAFREFNLWRERYPGGLTALEEDFVSSMVEQVRRNKRLTQLVAAVAFVLVTGVAVVFGISRQQARAEALRAEAAKLLALGELQLAEDPTEALAFATASLELADTKQARTFAMKALWEAPPAFELIASSQAAEFPDFNPDGKWLAAAGLSSDVLVWAEDGRGPFVLRDAEAGSGGASRAQWASKDLLVTGQRGGTARGMTLWSFPGGERTRTIDLGGPSSWQVGQGRLFAETLESDEPENSRGLLRSWKFPDGAPAVLGSVDWGELGTDLTFFTPDGENWVYIKDDGIYARPLPVGRDADHVMGRLREKTLRFWNEPHRVVVADESGETHVWSYSLGGAIQKNVFRRAEQAHGTMFPDMSGRWLADDPNVEQQIRLWDLKKWSSARPLSLRRSGSWYGAEVTFHPMGQWVVSSTATLTRLTFWPLARDYPSVADGYKSYVRPMAFSPDGRWLATSWNDQGLRLWPLPGDGVTEPRLLTLPEIPFELRGLAFDPKGRYVFAAGDGRAWLIPLDGSAPRKLGGFSDKDLPNAAAVSPSGRFAATAHWWGQGKKTLRVWDVETGELRHFDLPASETDASGILSGYEQGIASLAFSNESTLYTAGDGGLRRWNLETGTQELVDATPRGFGSRGALLADRGLVLTAGFRLGQWEDCSGASLRDLTSGTAHELWRFGSCSEWSKFGMALDPSGTVAAIGDVEGTVRVARLSGGEPYLLVGHRGPVDYVAISPDLRWVATTGMDNTLRLWPMPDLSKPPLHTLPHDELVAKLHSLTNFRVVRDPSAPNGWKVEIGPFPGWKNAPTW